MDQDPGHLGRNRRVAQHSEHAACPNPAVTGTKDWTEVSTVFQTGTVTAIEINCLFGGWGVSTGQAWYDDVSVQPINLPEELEATVTVDAAATITQYSPMIFGGFLEHFGRQIYGGVFEPESSLSDEMDFAEM